MYKFKIPIGDWSGDGHDHREDFLIESSLPVEEVRELYFKACERIGFSLDGSYKQTNLTPVAEYEDSVISPETIEALELNGVIIPPNLIPQPEDDDELYMGTDDMCELVLAFIRSEDPTIEIHIVPKEDVPMFQFYGFDDQNRHIGYFGYGLF